MSINKSGFVTRIWRWEANNSWLGRLQTELFYTFFARLLAAFSSNSQTDQWGHWRKPGLTICYSSSRPDRSDQSVILCPSRVTFIPDLIFSFPSLSVFSSSSSSSSSGEHLRSFLHDLSNGWNQGRTRSGTSEKSRRTWSSNTVLDLISVRSSWWFFPSSLPSGNSMISGGSIRDPRIKVNKSCSDSRIYDLRSILTPKVYTFRSWSLWAQK